MPESLQRDGEDGLRFSTARDDHDAERECDSCSQARGGAVSPLERVTWPPGTTARNTVESHPALQSPTTRAEFDRGVADATMATKRGENFGLLEAHRDRVGRDARARQALRAPLAQTFASQNLRAARVPAALRSLVDRLSSDNFASAFIPAA